MFGKYGKTIQAQWQKVMDGEMTEKEFLEWKKEFNKKFMFFCHRSKDTIDGPSHPNEWTSDLGVK